MRLPENSKGYLNEDVLNITLHNETIAAILTLAAINHPTFDKRQDCPPIPEFYTTFLERLNKGEI